MLEEEIFWRRPKPSQGAIIPSQIVFHVTSFCSNNCSGCYSKKRVGELDLRLFEKSIKEAEELGRGYTFLGISGGEPLAREDIWKIVALHPTSHFLIYTSGAQFWQRVIELERLSNIFIFFSLKLDKCGEEKGRDLGQILEYCQKHQLPFGISLLVTQENAGYITSENYLRPWIEIGARSLLFMVFRSFQDSNGEEFGHTMGSKQIFYLLQKIEYLRNLFRVPIMRGLTGHGVTDCRAANKILSISPSGEIQICPFAPISIGNIRDCSLEEALKSPVCRIIRFINKTNKFLLRNPCMNFCNLLSKVNGLEVHSP